MNRLKESWGRLGGRLGILLCLGGFVAIYFGWNGAASYDRTSAQLPYLISGGLVGLSLVVIGAAMMVVETNRQRSDELQATLLEIRDALEGQRMGPPADLGAGVSTLAADGLVVAGSSSYHRPDCRLLQGRADVELITTVDAADRGLDPCRICEPGGSPIDGQRRLRAN